MFSWFPSFKRGRKNSSGSQSSESGKREAALVPSGDSSPFSGAQSDAGSDNHSMVLKSSSSDDSRMNVSGRSQCFMFGTPKGKHQASPINIFISCPTMAMSPDGAPFYVINQPVNSMTIPRPLAIESPNSAAVTGANNSSVEVSPKSQSATDGNNVSSDHSTTDSGGTGLNTDLQKEKLPSDPDFVKLVSNCEKRLAASRRVLTNLLANKKQDEKDLFGDCDSDDEQEYDKSTDAAGSVTNAKFPDTDAIKEKMKIIESESKRVQELLIMAIGRAQIPKSKPEQNSEEDEYVSDD